MQFSVEMYKLSNGVRVMGIPVDGVDSVIAMVFVRTGSRNEDDRVSGISHVLEHMLFKGTEKYPTAKDVAMKVDGMGAEFNAFTSKEYTAYYIKSAKKWLSESLFVLGDMVMRPRLREDDWKREMGVIIEEMNMYKDRPMSKVMEDFENLMFKGCNLGRLIIGNEESVSGLVRDDLVEYMNRWYRGSNVLVAVVGGYDGDWKGVVDGVFGEMSDGDVMEYVDSGLYGSESEFVDDKGTEQTHFVLGYPGLSLSDERRSVESLLRVVLGGNMSSRLFTEVREKRGLAYYVSAFVEHMYDVGYFGVRAGVKKDQFDEALRVVKDEIRKVIDTVTEDELQRAKDYLSGKVVLSLESLDSVVRWFGSREIVMGDIEQPIEFMRLVEKVSVDDVKKLAGELFVEDNMKLAVVK